jgi:hypothetical protein
MCKHDDLQAIIGHVLRHRPIGVDHAPAEIIAAALDGKCTTAVPDPIFEGLRWILTQPSDKKLSNFFVANGIRVWWISDKNVA